MRWNLEDVGENSTCQTFHSRPVAAPLVPCQAHRATRQSSPLKSPDVHYSHASQVKAPRVSQARPLLRTGHLQYEGHAHPAWAWPTLRFPFLSGPHTCSTTAQRLLAMVTSPSLSSRTPETEYREPEAGSHWEPLPQSLQQPNPPSLKRGGRLLTDSFCSPSISLLSLCVSFSLTHCLSASFWF